MNAETATAFITSNKGAEILVVLNDASTYYGEALSVNSKGVNIKVDGKTRSFALGRVDVLELADTDNGEGTPELEDIINEISDGATTAEIAAHLTEYLKHEVTPKELRVHLRALGLGVGKGRKYALSAGEFQAVLKLIDVPA
jgi:hypothetical protein